MEFVNALAQRFQVRIARRRFFYFSSINCKRREKLARRVINPAQLRKVTSEIVRDDPMIRKNFAHRNQQVESGLGLL